MMDTIAWLLILSGFVLIRQVTKGRVMNLGQDLSDAFLAIASGDQGKLSEVISRNGDSATDTDGTTTLTKYGAGNPANAAGANTPAANATILRSAVDLGQAAKGYRFAATGPDYYDCSGLMWRACQKAGYKGARFTTFTLKGNKAFTQVSDPKLGVSTVTLGDIVLWPTHHMGVVSGNGRFYSARSVKSGISEANIENFGGYGTPIYMRYTG
jgi:cell wall-associated NlpC family hydrolase